MRKFIFLSHMLDENVPSYGNKTRLLLTLKKSLALRDSCNESLLELPTHLGTHIDVPIHFYSDGQAVGDFSADFWVFSQPIYIEIIPRSLIIYHEIINQLKSFSETELQRCDILLVNTGSYKKRFSSEFWEHNPGFSPDLYDFFKTKLPSVRMFGFDSISLSSFQHRDIGKQAHLRFLNPEAPILPIEDMNFFELDRNVILGRTIVSPLRINNCDGLPCTIFSEILK